MVTTVDCRLQSLYAGTIAIEKNTNKAFVVTWTYAMNNEAWKEKHAWRDGMDRGLFSLAVEQTSDSLPDLHNGRMCKVSNRLKSNLTNVSVCDSLIYYWKSPRRRHVIGSLH